MHIRDLPSRIVPMLDNLKLGYGGTKTEMERLIADANKVKEANGEMADLSIDSFADVTEAIHIIQEEMGITGTTAKEAASTIEGSVNSAKAAWDNFLTGSIYRGRICRIIDYSGICDLKESCGNHPKACFDDSGNCRFTLPAACYGSAGGWK